MEPRSRDALVATLWSADGEDLYAVLDAARDPRIRAKLVASDARTVCLYEGSIPKELAAVAPYLVKLRPGDRFSEQLVESAWGNSWGVFARSASDFEAVRRHFRRLLRVTDPRGRTLLFRYYDPRALRVYLPTCTEAELEAFFGPLSAYVVEEEDPRSANVYASVGRVYAMGRVALAPRSVVAVSKDDAVVPPHAPPFR